MAGRTTMAGTMGEAMRGMLQTQEKIVDRIEKLSDFLRDNFRGRS